MTRKRPDPFLPVRAVIRQLSHLTHDELRDLADMLIADAAFDADEPRHIPQRHGLPPVDPEGGHTFILRGGWQYRDDPPLYTPPARDELHDAYESAEALRPEARALVADVAKLLRDSVAPVAERRITADGTPLAEGTIQAKIIRRKVVDPDTGEIEIRPFGPYLYYRYWVSGGDSDKRGRRLKNKYIGRQALAQHFARTPAGSDERRELEARIIEAFKAGTVDRLMLDMGLIPDEPVPVGGELGHIDTVPNTPPDADDDTAAPASALLPDYVPAPTRKQPPQFFAMTDVRRDVLAAYAAGQNYAADYAEGIQKRKIARELAEAGLLAEVTGYVDHKKHNWRLTEAGLKLIRRDTDLQQRIVRRLK